MWLLSKMNEFKEMKGVEIAAKIKRLLQAKIEMRDKGV